MGLLVGIELDMMAGPVVEVARDMGVLAITAGKVRTWLGWQKGGEQHVWEHVRQGPGNKMAKKGGLPRLVGHHRQQGVLALGQRLCHALQGAWVWMRRRFEGRGIERGESICWRGRG